MTDDREKLDNIRRNTVMLRAKPMIDSLITNLMTRAKDRPHIGRSLRERVYAGQAAYVIGAGPSLNKNISGLPWAQGSGQLVACNTAIGALAKAGIRPDVAICLESLNLSKQLEPHRGVPLEWLTVLTTNPANWFDDGLWVGTDSPAEPTVVRKLGLEPLKYGPSATTACVALALQLGANPIVLVGMDLSYPQGESAYAKDSTWEGFRGTLDDEGKLIFSGREDRHQLHKEGGLRGIPTVHEPRQMKGWGDGPDVYTTFDMIGQMNWFSAVAKSRPDVTFLNATEGGAHVPGWQDVSLRHAWASRPVADRRSLSRDAVKHEGWQAAVDETLRQCAVAKRSARLFQTLDLSALEPALESLWTPTPMVDLLAWGAILEMQASAMARKAKIVATYDIIHEAAEYIEKRIRSYL